MTSRAYTVKILVVILTTIPWLIFLTSLSSLPLDDTIVTHVIAIGNRNLGDESVVTNDDPVVTNDDPVVTNDDPVVNC